MSEEDAALMIVRYYLTLDNDAAATAFIGGLAAEESAALNEIVKLLEAAGALPSLKDSLGFRPHDLHPKKEKKLRKSSTVDMMLASLPALDNSPDVRTDIELSPSGKYADTNEEIFF